MKEHLINTPSLLEFTIREGNGSDDEVLTTFENNSDADVIDKYVQRLILKGPGGTPLSLDQVRDLPLRDKYVLLIKMRILSLSEKLIFKYPWSNLPAPEEYEINLEDFVWDYNKPLPVSHEEGYSDLRIKPYALPNLDLELSTGKKLKINLLNGHGEKLLLTMAPSDRNINSNLKARGMSLLEGDKYVSVINFAPFSAREMAEIRAHVDEYDEQVSGEVEISNPRTYETVMVSILAIKDFFYPAKI